MDLVGELLINKNRLQMLVFEYKVSGSEEALTQLGMLLDDLQNQVFQARLLPIDYILNQFPRVVRDLSREENKKVELELRGANTEMDKAILDSLSEPLIHLIRNAVDHGIEKPEERKRKGKREVGKIWIRAKREQNSIVMEVEDDGGGIDIEAIKQRGLEKELIGAKASEEEILNLLFIPGFSGAKKITRVSGRGVGMDVVREVVESLKGSVSIRTQKGKGTKVSLTLPFTTAISKALIVRANGNKYGILLHDIQSTINLEKAKIRGVENKKVVLLRDTIAPLIDLQQLFLGEEREKKPLGKYGIIIKDENRSAVIEVEDILGQQELVVRPLTPLLGSIKFFSGTAILGDGTVILTLNPASILSSGKS
jgi:two-component system chemotaxis sensor kinase CheA